MNSTIIIITILILVKVAGAASHAKAENYIPGYDCIHKPAYGSGYFNYTKTYNCNQERWEKKVEEMKLKRGWLEDTKFITDIDDYSYTVQYLNGKKQYCIRNDFKTLDCVNYSLVSSTLNKKSNE